MRKHKKSSCPTGNAILQEPNQVRVDYELTWMKPKIDLKGLAKLRESGMSFREIAKKVGIGTTTVMQKLLQYYEEK
jgi:phage antirepressor YoqD-like protein